MSQPTVSHLFATTLLPTPVFNTPEIASCFGGKNGDSLLLDEQGMMREIETILFSGSPIKLIEKVQQAHIWRIETHEYPYNIDLFIDDRFIIKTEKFPSERKMSLPSHSAILETMAKLENTRYIWGGNWPQGIDLLPHLYPSKTELSKLNPLINDTWKLKGVDCSGLLHYATNGSTPRNTSSLVNFGKSVNIEGENISFILEKLQPLDLIVWKGHVVCILDKATTIESKPSEGVVKFDSHERLTDIMKERKPANAWNNSDEPIFVVRRWHTDYRFS